MTKKNYFKQSRLTALEWKEESNGYGFALGTMSPLSRVTKVDFFPRDSCSSNYIIEIMDDSSSTGAAATNTKTIDYRVEDTTAQEGGAAGHPTVATDVNPVSLDEYYIHKFTATDSSSESASGGDTRCTTAVDDPSSSAQWFIVEYEKDGNRVRRFGLNPDNVGVPKSETTQKGSSLKSHLSRNSFILISL